MKQATENPGAIVVFFALAALVCVVWMALYPWWPSMRRNELEAIQTLMALVESQEIYAHENHGAFAPDFRHLLVLGPQWMDVGLSDGRKSGYAFHMHVKDDCWEVWATPLQWGRTGSLGLYLDPAGAVHYEEGRSAGPRSAVYEMQEE